MIRFILPAIIASTLAACSAPPPFWRPPPPSKEVQLSPRLSRTCDGHRAIYEINGFWTTRHEVRENDPVCGGSAE